MTNESRMGIWIIEISKIYEWAKNGYNKYLRFKNTGTSKNGQNEYFKLEKNKNQP